MEKNVVKMIDLTQFVLMESTGDSEAKSDLDNYSFSKSHQGFVAEFDDNDDDEDENDDDDAESCSYGSSHSGYADGICHGYRDKKNVHQHDNDDDDDDDGMSYHDDEMEDDDDDAIDSKMVEVSKKCGVWQDKRDCSNTRFLNEKENDKNFWETCLAS